MLEIEIHEVGKSSARISEEKWRDVICIWRGQKVWIREEMLIIDWNRYSWNGMWQEYLVYKLVVIL